MFRDFSQPHKIQWVLGVWGEYFREFLGYWEGRGASRVGSLALVHQVLALGPCYWLSEGVERERVWGLTFLLGSLAQDSQGMVLGSCWGLLEGETRETKGEKVKKV